MRHLFRLLVLGQLLLTIPCRSFLGVSPAGAQTPGHLWSEGLGGASDEQGKDVAVDASGNVYVTGFFQGMANFGGSDLTSAGGNDLFLAKYNALGAHVWSVRFGTTGSETVESMALDASGNVYVAGSFSGTGNFGGGDLVSAGSSDIFIARYSSSGAHGWSQRFGSTGADVATSIGVDTGSNVLVTGRFSQTVNFGGVALVSAGSNDIFIAKYNTFGTHQWSIRFGSTGSDSAEALAVNGTNVLVTGSFSGTVNFGFANLVSAGGTDVFEAKFNTNGIHQWSQRYGGTSADVGTAVAADASSNVLVAGTFNGTVSFGGANLVTAGGTDVFLAKYNSVGTHIWSQREGGALIDDVGGVAVDAVGNVLISGMFTGTANYGGGTLSAPTLNTDMVIARYTSAGVHVWSGGAGSSTSNDNAPALVADASGNVLVTGYTGDTANLGGFDLPGLGGSDLIIAKYSYDPAEPTITSIADIGNDQGRKVKLRFNRSGADDPIATIPVTLYEAYRRDDAPPPATMVRAGDLAAMSARELAANGWSFVGSAPPHTEPTYGFDVPTIGDSTLALGQYYSVFYVRAATGIPAQFHDSAVDSGYSRDNLAPGVPQNFTYAAGDLTWHESTAKDFDFFTVYGSNTDSFGAATLVDYSVAPTLNVTASPYVYYYVTATDFSGNEGKPAKINTLSGIGGTPKSYVLSLSNYPNPFNPRTTVSYTIPTRGPVTISIYDAHGARVATLFKGERNAGAYSVDWDGRTDDAASAASGIYFARIEHASGTRTKKMVLLK